MKALSRINLLLTVSFLITTVVAAVVFSPTTRALGVAMDLTLFAIGVAAFIWAYFSAVQRSRVDEISVASLYLLTSGVVAQSMARIMNGCLIAQVLIGLGGAVARPSTDGRSGSTLAFGVLVPLLGLGLNGLLVSRFGSFTPRTPSDRQE